MENKTTIIIPIHEYNDSILELLEKAVKSIEEQTLIPNVLIISPESVNTEISKSLTTKLPIIKLINDGETNFCSQINNAVKSVETEYFTILEFDDQLNKKFNENLSTYIENEPKVDVFLSIVKLVDENNKMLGLVNEAVWAQGFSTELGYLDLKSTIEYDSFISSGGSFRTDKFIDAGGFKTNIKLFFMYELFLRLLNNDLKIFVIPKYGYEHLIGRPTSLFESYKDENTGLEPEEVQFYLEAAKREYFFNPNEINREITFIPKVTEG